MIRRQKMKLKIIASITTRNKKNDLNKIDISTPICLMTRESDLVSALAKQSVFHLIYGETG